MTTNSSLTADDLDPPRPMEAAGQGRAVLNQIAAVFEGWALTNPQSAALMDVPLPTWNRMKAGRFKGRLDQDKVTRAAIILRLDAAVAPPIRPPLGPAWLTRANTSPGFEGDSPLFVMQEGGIPAMLTIAAMAEQLRMRQLG